MNKNNTTIKNLKDIENQFQKEGIIFHIQGQEKKIRIL